MSLLCRLVGHKTQEGVYSGAEYMRARPGSTDHIGREHWYLYAECRRCEAEYLAGKIHGPLKIQEPSHDQ